VLWLVLQHHTPVIHAKIAGNSDRLSVTLLSPVERSKPRASMLPAETKHEEKKTQQTRKKVETAHRHSLPLPRHEPVLPKPLTPPVVADTAPKEMQPPPAADLSSMIAAARKRREQMESRSDTSMQEDDTQKRDRQVQQNIAMSIGQAMGTDQNGHGGVFQLRRVGSISAEFLFRGWNADLRRNSTQLVEVFKKSEPDIQTAVVKKMIAIIRENKHDEFEWDSYRLGRVVTLSARPENEARLEHFLMQEFFPDYVSLSQ
jgi:hypothetical protein